MRSLKKKCQTKKCGGAFSGVAVSPYSFRPRKLKQAAAAPAPAAAAPAAASKKKASKKSADYPNKNEMNIVLLRHITNIFGKIQDFESSSSPMDSLDFHSTLDDLVDWVLGKSSSSPFTQTTLNNMNINAIKNMIQLFVIRQIECERTNLTKGNLSHVKDYITIERDAVSDNRHRDQIIDFWQSDIGKDIMKKCFNTLHSAYIIPIPFTLSDKTVTMIIDHDDGKPWYAAHTVQAAWMLTGGTETKSSFEIDSDDFFLSLLGKCQKYGPGHAFPTSLAINKQHRNWTRPDSIGVWSGLGLYLVAYIKCIEMTFIDPKNTSGASFAIPPFDIDNFYKKAKETYLKEVMFNTIIEHIVKGHKEHRKLSCLTKTPVKEGNTTQKMLKRCQHLSIDSIVSITINSLLNLLDPKLCRIISQKATLLLGSSAAENTRTRPFVPGCQGPSNYAAELLRRMMGNTTFETIFGELNDEVSITAKNIYTSDKLIEVKGKLSHSIDVIIKEDEEKKDQENKALEKAEKALEAARAYEEEFTSILINDNEKLTEKYEEIKINENALITKLNHAVEELQRKKNNAVREQSKRNMRKIRRNERTTTERRRANKQIRELEINAQEKDRKISELEIIAQEKDRKIQELQVQLEAAIQKRDFIKEKEIIKKIKKIRHDNGNLRTSIRYKRRKTPFWNISQRQKNYMKKNQKNTRSRKLQKILKERRNRRP
jgi:hypothetical protein